MKTRETLRTVGYMLVAVAVTTLVSAQQRRTTALSGEDHAEIQNLYARYHWIGDTGDAVGWANLFTADGIYERGSVKAVGREQLIEQGKKSFRPPTAKSGLRFNTNVRIEPSPEGARGG